MTRPFLAILLALVLIEDGLGVLAVVQDETVVGALVLDADARFRVVVEGKPSHERKGRPKPPL